MAEIHVERKRGVATWLWVLALIIIVAAVIAYLWYNGTITFSMSPMQQQVVALISAGGGNGT